MEKKDNAMYLKVWFTNNRQNYLLVVKCYQYIKPMIYAGGMSFTVFENPEDKEECERLFTNEGKGTVECETIPGKLVHGCMWGWTEAGYKNLTLDIYGEDISFEIFAEDYDKNKVH